MSDTIQDSIDHARARAEADPLSDPDKLENSAIFDWMKHHVSFVHHRQRFVLGTGGLPLPWLKEVFPISTQQDAMKLLRPLKSDHAAMSGMRRAFVAISSHAAPTDEAVITGLADRLAIKSGVWLIVNPRKPRISHGTTSPEICARLNSTGLKVDFQFVSELEGYQVLRGYVPLAGKTAIVAGQSGMSIATAFDVGQKSQAEIDALNLPKSVVDKIKPYVNIKFRKWTHKQVNAFIKKTAPVPVLTKEEADAVDFALFGQHLRAAVRDWDTLHKKGVPDFADLPAAWQTVLFSRTYQQGTDMPRKSVSRAFYEAATAGRWGDAADALQHYGMPAWNSDRVAREARLLRTQMPPPVVLAPPVGLQPK